MLHGWPGIRARGLVALANRIIKADHEFPRPVEPVIAVRHPFDDDVWLEIRAFSRPATWFAKLGGPATGLVQDWATARYRDALQRLATIG